MNHELTVSIQQMKDTLRQEVGSQEPLMITRKDDVTMVVYIRGFADQQTNILLISESPDAIALRIMEIRDIRKIQFMDKNKNITGRALEAKWFPKVKKYTMNIEGASLDYAAKMFGISRVFATF